MKARLEFTLPEEDIEFRHAMTAGDMHSALREFDNELREFIKYGTRPDLDLDTVEVVRTLLGGVLDRWDIALD